MGFSNSYVERLRKKARGDFYPRDLRYYRI